MIANAVLALTAFTLTAVWAVGAVHEISTGRVRLLK